MGKIKNTESLLNHGDRESRKKITELLERMWRWKAFIWWRTYVCGR